MQHWFLSAENLASINIQFLPKPPSKRTKREIQTKSGHWQEEEKEWGKRRTADVMVLGSNGQSPWLQHPKFESWWNLQFLLCTIWWKRSKINKQEAWRDPFFNWYRKYLTNKFQNIAQYKINPAIRCKN